MLVLCVHTVSSATAKVPFSMMILLDHVRKRDLPPELKCRQVFPTSGLRSTSLWDTTDIETLQLWLDEYLDADCTNEVFEIQEEFAFGISAELTRLRTAEKVSAAVSERTKTAAAAASQQVTELDAKYRVSEQATSVLKAARDASRAAGTRVATSLGAVQARAMENERVAAAATQLNASWRRLGAQVPAFFNRSPAGSDGGSPMTKPPSAADPPFGKETPTSSNAAAPPPSTGQAQTPIRDPTLKGEAASEPKQPSPLPATAAVSPAKPPVAKQQADGGKGSLFTLDDAEG